MRGKEEQVFSFLTSENNFKLERCTTGSFFRILKMMNGKGKGKLFSCFVYLLLKDNLISERWTISVFFMIFKMLTGKSKGKPNLTVTVVVDVLAGCSQGWENRKLEGC